MSSIAVIQIGRAVDIGEVTAIRGGIFVWSSRCSAYERPGINPVGIWLRYRLGLSEEGGGSRPLAGSTAGDTAGGPDW